MVLEEVSNSKWSEAKCTYIDGLDELLMELELLSEWGFYNKVDTKRKY